MSVTAAQSGFRRRFWPWIKWALAAGLLGLLCYLHRDTLTQLSVDDIPWEFAGVAVVLTLAAVLLTFLRWYLLVWAQDFDFSLVEAVRLGFLGYISNYIAPGAVGGDAVKAVVLCRQQTSRRAVAVGTIVLDRLLGLLALFLVGGGVWFLQSGQTRHGVFQTVALIFGIGAAAGLVMMLITLHTPILQADWLKRCVRWRYVGPLIGQMLNAVALYRSRVRVLWLCLIVSLLGHFSMLSAFYFCAAAVNPPGAIPGYFEHLLFMPAAELAGMIPLFPGGVGALEGVTAKFYELAGFSEGNGLLTGVAYRAVSILIAVLGTGYFFSGRREVREALETEPAAIRSETT